MTSLCRRVAKLVVPPKNKTFEEQKISVFFFRSLPACPLVCPLACLSGSLVGSAHLLSRLGSVVVVMSPPEFYKYTGSKQCAVIDARFRAGMRKIDTSQFSFPRCGELLKTCTSAATAHLLFDYFVETKKAWFATMYFNDIVFYKLAEFARVWPGAYTYRRILFGIAEPGPGQHQEEKQEEKQEPAAAAAEPALKPTNKELGQS